MLSTKVKTQSLSYTNKTDTSEKVGKEEKSRVGYR